MNKLAEFAAANPYLVTATVVMLIAVVAFELRLRARGAFQVTVGEAVRMINLGATVVDVRDAAKFAAGHIVDAINMSAAELSRGEEGKIKKKRAVLVISDNVGESLDCAQKLQAAGFEGALSLAGGIEGWQRENQPLVRKRA